MQMLHEVKGNLNVSHIIIFIVGKNKKNKNYPHNHPCIQKRSDCELFQSGFACVFFLFFFFFLNNNYFGPKVIEVVSCPMSSIFSNCEGSPIQWTRHLNLTNFLSQLIERTKPHLSI